jgi:hypothetical protein
MEWKGLNFTSFKVNIGFFKKKDVFASDRYFAEGADDYCVSCTHTVHLVSLFRHISFMAILI